MRKLSAKHYWKSAPVWRTLSRTSDRVNAYISFVNYSESFASKINETAYFSQHVLAVGNSIAPIKKRLCCSKYK